MKGTLLVTYTVYSEMCGLHLTYPWGAVGSHSPAPRDQLQIVSQYLCQGYWLEIHLYTCFDRGRNRSTRRKPMGHRENTQTPHKKVLPQLGIKPRIFLLWGDRANHYITMPSPRRMRTSNFLIPSFPLPAWLLLSLLRLRVQSEQLSKPNQTKVMAHRDSLFVLNTVNPNVLKWAHSSKLTCHPGWNCTSYSFS